MEAESKRHEAVNASRQGQRADNGRTASDAKAARLKAKDSKHARPMAGVDKRGKEAQKRADRRQNEPTLGEEEALNQATELDKRAKELDAGQAQVTFKSWQLRIGSPRAGDAA